MLSTLLVLASAEGEETSKTAFYVAGSVLAGFAVLLSVLGMAKPDFPGSDGAARATMGVGAVLVLATLVAVLATA